MEYTKYTTRQGDTWDMIAYNAYGDVKYMKDILLANDCPVYTEFPDGIVLRIPILELVGSNLDSVPFWKQ